MNAHCLRVLVIEDNAGEAKLLQALFKQALFELSEQTTWALHWVQRLERAIAVLQNSAQGKLDTDRGEILLCPLPPPTRPSDSGPVTPAPSARPLEQGGHSTPGYLPTAESAAAFDVILLDLTLPDSQGLDSLVRLAAEAPAIPIVVLTNTKDAGLALEAIRAGAQDYLVKRHLHPEVLTRSIRYAIERKRSEEELKYANENLEQQVSDRTADLVAANRLLSREIDHRQGIEARLLMEKQLAEVSLDAIGDAVIVLDRRGRISALNPAAETLCAWTMAQAFGMPCEEVLELDYHEGRQAALDHGLTKVLQGGKAVTGQCCVAFINRRQRSFILEISISPIRIQVGEVAGAVMVCHDVTEHQHMSANLAWQASHDALTGLVNRREFERALGAGLLEGANGQQTHVLCYLDLDQFKVVNDTSGHIAGDTLLCQIAQMLKRLTRPEDLLARLGGDEFGVLLRNCTVEEAIAQVQGMVEQVNHQFLWDDNVFTISVSAGLVALNQSIDDMVGVLGMADTAMYLSKD